MNSFNLTLTDNVYLLLCILSDILLLVDIPIRNEYCSYLSMYSNVNYECPLPMSGLSDLYGKSTCSLAYKRKFFLIHMTSVTSELTECEKNSYIALFCLSDQIKLLLYTAQPNLT